MANGFDEMDEFDGGGGDEFARLSNAELYRQAYGGGTDAGGAEDEDGGAAGVGGGDEFAGLSNAELYRQAFAGPARREEAGASLPEPERGERGRFVYGRVNLNALPTHDELAAKGERGGVETAMLNRQEETGIESDYDGSWWGGVRDASQAFAHAVFGRPITNAMNANLQALARGTYTDIFGNETPLEQLPDATLDYVMDNTGANGFAGARALLGERASHAWRGEDNIMRQWDEREGAKFADEAERKRARVAYAKELAQNMISMQEESKLAASDELAAREETFKGALGRGLLEQGGYTARFMIGKYGFIAGVLEGVERAGELLSDKTKVDKNGEIVADAKRDTMGAALAKGAARGVIAPAVELVGGKLLMAGAKGAVRNTLGRIPLVKAVGGKLATTAAGKSVAAFARKMDYVGRMTGMGSFPEEMAEEWEDQVLDAAIGLDRRASENAGTTALGRARESNAQFFTAQNLGDLAKSMILMQVIQGGAAHALDRMNARRVDAVLENVCGVERGKLRNWTANQKQQAFTAWVEGLSEENVRNMVDGGSRALNRFMSEMFGGHGMAPVALKDGEGRTVGRALVRTGRGGATAGEVNEALGEIRRAAGENDFTERDADGNPVERRFTPQTAEDGKGGRKPMWTPAQDEAGNPVLRLVDAENGVTIDSYDFPGDDAPTYRVYDARGRQRAADGIENALAYANGMVADLAQRNAKLRYIRRMAGDVLRNQRVFVGDTMADVRRDYDAQFGAGAFDRAMKSGDGQYIEGEGDGEISGASFWMPETDADGKSTLVPATDRDGNPVYETDAKGKPVLDAAGNPVRKMVRPRAVFFALDSNRSVAELNATAYHEVARHSGLAQMYTPEEKADFLRRLSAGSFGDAKNRMDWDGLVRGQMAFRGKKSEAELWKDPDAVEEIFAVMTEGMTESPSLKQRFMANVYDWYRNRFKQNLDIQPDELAVVVDELNRFARRGGGAAPGGGVTYQAREGRELEGDLANVKAMRAMRRDAANARPALPYTPDAAEGTREKTFGEQKAEEDAADAALAERMEADRAGDENPFSRAKERAKEIDRKNGSESEKVVDLANAVEDGNENEISRAQGRHFRLARTSDLLKECGLSGDFFTIRTGVVLRHHGKDSGHAISANEWVDISVALTERKPQLVERYGKSEKSYRIWTEAKIGGKTAIVGVDVKSVGMDMEVNSISTAFGASGAVPKEENIVYPKTKKEIQSVLTRHNSGRYPGSPSTTKSIAQSDGGVKGGEDARQTRKNAPVSAPTEAGTTTQPRDAARAEGRESGDEAVAAFDRNSTVLSGDEVRKTMPGYDPKDWRTHVDRTGYVGPRLEAQFRHLLKTRKGKGNGTVVFLAGGNGAGKSTFAQRLGVTPDFTIDSTLGNLDATKRQIDAILANGEKPIITFVYRNPREAIEGIRNRVANGGHTVSPLSFANSHVKSRDNLRLLSEAYGDKIDIRIYDNSVPNGPRITPEQLEEKERIDHEELRRLASERLGQEGRLAGSDRTGSVHGSGAKSEGAGRAEGGAGTGRADRVDNATEGQRRGGDDDAAYRDWLARTLRKDTPENRAKYGTDLVAAVADYAKALGRSRNIKNTRTRLESVLRGMADGKAWRWSVPARGGGRVRVNLEDALARLDKAGKLYGGDGRAVLAPFRSLVEGVYPSVSQGRKDRVADVVRNVLGPLWPAHRQAYKEENRARYAPLAEERSRAAKRTLHGAKEYAEEQGDLRAYADAHPESRIARWLGTTMFVPSEGDNAAIHDWWKQNVGFGKDMDRATARFLAGRNLESGSNDGSDWWREAGEDLSDGNDGADWDRITHFLDALLDERARALEWAGKTRGGERAAGAEGERAPSWYGKAEEDMTEGERNAMEAFARDELDEIEGANYDVTDDPHTLFRRSPSGAEAAERARREYDEVVARYTNPDGTKRPGWMRAPNGKPTRLTERQWVQVRTPSFKKWFGDWERGAVADAILGDADIASDGALLKMEAKAQRAEAKRIYDALKAGGPVETADGRSVHFLTRGFKEIKSHSADPHTLAIVPILKEVVASARYIGEGDVAATAANKDVKAYHIYARRVNLGDGSMVARIVIREDKNGNQFYDEESTSIENVKEIQGQGSREPNTGSGPESPYAPHSLAEFFGGINPDSVSKVVDENGEPLVVYHGSPHEFSVFDRRRIRNNTRNMRGFFFTTNRDTSGYYGKEMPCFLNVRRPLVETRGEGGEETIQAALKDGSIARHDGTIAYAGEDIKSNPYLNRGLAEDGIIEIVVLNPTQIKSATDNTGAFDPANPDIRFSVRRVTTEEDAAYMDAVRRGDMEAAEKMERDAVARAMPDTKVVGADGKPMKVYHGSRTGANIKIFRTPSFFSDNRDVADMFKKEADFILRVNGKEVAIDDMTARQIADELTGGDYTPDEMANWGSFAESIRDIEDNGKGYGGRDVIADALGGVGIDTPLDEITEMSFMRVPDIYECYVNITNPLEIDFKGKTWGQEGTKEMEAAVRDAAKNGYDGIIVRNIREGGFLGELRNGEEPPLSTDYIPVSPNQIKLADAVTRDDAGNVIPLSQRFDQQNQDIRFSIAGARGASALGVRGVADAEAMEKDGRDRTEIWRRTGWWRGADGKWRFELPPVRMKGEEEVMSALRDGGNEATLGKLLDAPKLFAAYPQLKGVKVVFSPEYKDGIDGWYAPALGEIRLFNTGLRSPADQDEYTRKAYDNYLRIVDSDEYLRKILEDFDAIGIEHGTFEEERADARWMIEHMDRRIADRNAATVRGIVNERGEESVYQRIVHEVQHAVQMAEGFEKGGDVADADYWRIAGEVEARNAARRDAMTPEERAATPPWETEDVPADSQIMRFSIRVNPRLREEVEAALAKRSSTDTATRQMKRHEEIEFSENIPFFGFLGLPNVRVVTDVVKIRKFAQKHHLTKEQIADIPNRYDRPVAVMKDGTDGYVVLTDMMAETDNGEEKPVRLFLRPKKWKSGEVVFVATAMSENAADERNYYEPILKSGLLFADENRIAGLGLEEETESILRTQASGDHVLTASDYSKWSTAHSVAQPGAGAQGPDVRFSIPGLYTGSAADYERPSLHYVGTGEGNQVYGWGLYASNRRGVAESYAKNNDGLHTFDGRPIEYISVALSPQEKAIKAFTAANGDKNRARETLVGNAKRARGKSRKEWDAAVEWFDENGGRLATAKPHLYEQTWFTDRAPGDESHLLKWYDAISDSNWDRVIAQAEKEGLREKLKGAWWLRFNGDLEHFITDNGNSGDAIYERLSKLLGGPQSASEFLARAGIDGVKYPVGSYGKAVKDGDEAGWNYVSFRDDNIRVDHKWRDGGMVFRRVTDKSEIARLENDPKGYTEAYASAQVIDGKVYSPMAAYIDGKLTEPFGIGEWQKSEEHPELADASGNFKLDKTGRSKDAITAKYNPYWHSVSLDSPLNDQFSTAYARPNLVMIKVRIPNSDLLSGYRAENAKDPVGALKWKSGDVTNALKRAGKPDRTVFLSRYRQVLKVLSNEEAARLIARQLEGVDIRLPANVVTPAVRDLLVGKYGVRLGEPTGNANARAKYARELREQGVRFRMSSTDIDPITLRNEIDRSLKRNANGHYAAKANDEITFSEHVPHVLYMLGAKDARIYTKNYTIRKIIEDHSLLPEQVAGLVKSLENPVAVLSDDGGSYVVLTDIMARNLDGQMKPVMIWMRPDSKGNYIASAYSRTLAGEKKYVNLINAKRLLYLDKNKVAALNLGGEAKSSFVSPSSGNVVKTPEDLSSFVSVGIIPQTPTSAQGGVAMRNRRYTPDPTARLLADALGLSAREAAALATGAANAPLGVGNDRRDSMPGAARDLVDAVSDEEGIAAAFDTTRNLVGRLFGKGAAERWRALRRGLRRRLTNYLEPVVEMQRLVERRTLHRVRVEDSVADAAKFAYSHQTRMWEDAEREVLAPLYKEIAENGLDAPAKSIGEGTVLHELLLALHGPAFNRMISERTDGKTLDGSGASTAFWLGVLRGHGANGTDAQLLGALARGDYAALGWAGGSVGAKAAKAVSLVRELTDRTRDVLERSGRLGAKQRATWEALSPFYVPMRFDQNADDNFVKVWLHGGTLEGGGYARNYAGGESRHAFGHRNIADNPIVFAVQQHADAIQRATDNDVRRKLADMVRRNEFLGHVVDADGIVDMGGVVNPRAPSGFVGLPRAKTLGADTKARESTAVGSLEQEDNIVAFKEGGDVKFIVLGPRTNASGRGAAEDRALSEAEARLVGLAVKKTSLAQVGPVLKFVRGLTRTFGQLRTTLSPEFLVSNFLADNAQAAGNVYATFGAKGVAQFERGVPAALASARRMLNGKLGTSRMDAYAREMREGGGLIGGLSTANFADVQRDVEREVAKFAGDRKVRVLDFISHMAERMNAPFEVASRLSAYAVCRENGMTRAEAAKYAREVTVDFNQKGEWTPVLNALYAFSNASLVDMERSFGAYAARRGLRLSFALVALGFLSSMLGYWQDDPDDAREGAAQWKDTKDYVKQNKLGFRAGTNLYSVPIRGVNRVLYYAGHKLWEVLSGRKGAGEAAWEVGSFAASNLVDPIGDAAKPLQAVTPSVLRPGMELLQNESFSGTQIYREPMNRRLDVRSAMGRRTTPGIWHNVAEAMNAVTGGNRNKRGAIDVQPEVYQYVYSWLTGSAGNDIARAANVVKDIATWDFSDMEDARNVPFVRRFTSGLQANTPTFREKMDEFNEDVKQFKDVANEDPGVMADLRARHPFFGASPSARRWLGELTDLGKAARKLMKAEMSLDGEDRKAAHRLRLQVQAAFIHRFGHAPEEDTSDDRAFARSRDREAAKVIKANRK